VDFEDDFLVGSDSVFVNDFWVTSSLGVLKISTSTVELGSGDDICVGSDLVFNNNFWVRSGLRVLRTSASTEELDTGDDI